MIAGNHKPGLRSVDEAIRRRFNLIPFTVTIPLAERDLKLKAKLKAEWPGILAWAIDGCMEWQLKGLSAPEAVTRATAAYLEDEDAIAAWMEDCCVVDSQGWETSSDLFASWKACAEKAGEYVGSSKAFTPKLEARGFTSHRKNSARGYAGYRLIIKDSSNDWNDR